MSAWFLILGGGVVAYGLVVKVKGEQEMGESAPWWMVVGSGLLFIYIGL